jgi:Glycosyl transferase family 2
MFDRAKVQVIIPALDEAATIASVVKELRALGLERVRVVDNGSRDGTPEHARAAGAEVLVETTQGYGQACWTGAQNLPDEVEWILFCDADGSDDVGDVERLMTEAERGAQLVLGDRRARPEARAVMTPVQNFGNGLATTLIRLGWGQRYDDLGPLRLVQRSLFERAQMRDRGFGWTIELQVRAVELGARIVELPVGYRKRQGGRSKISGTLKGSVQAGTIILSTLGILAARRVGARLGLAGGLVLAGAMGMWPHGAPRAADVPWLLSAAAVMAVGFVLTWRAGLARGEEACRRVPPAWWFWLVAIGARALLLPMEPGDDVWRYLWEGKVQLHGFSPFQFAPNAPELAGLRTEWWSAINHEDKTAIYPPLLQLGFRGVAALMGDAVGAWKLIFVLADLAICAVLARMLGRGAALLFAWNPLVIYATAGGAHFEALLLLPLVLGWRAWTQGKRKQAAGWFGLSVGVKWVTAPLVIWAAWQERTRPWRALGLLALGILPTVAGLVWFRVEFGPLGALAPADFVAKARALDFFPWLVGLVWDGANISNNWIPLLFLPLASWGLLKARTAESALERYFTVLLLCLPSVHAWYFTWLAPWAVVTGNLGARLLSISGFVYFWVWRTHELTGRWEVSALERLLVWSPLVLGTAWWLWRGRQADLRTETETSVTK